MNTSEDDPRMIKDNRRQSPRVTDTRCESGVLPTYICDSMWLAPFQRMLTRCNDEDGAREILRKSLTHRTSILSRRSPVPSRSLRRTKKTHAGFSRLITVSTILTEVSLDPDRFSLAHRVTHPSNTKSGLPSLATGNLRR